MVTVNFITDLPPSTNQWGRIFNAFIVMADYNATKEIALSSYMKTSNAIDTAVLYHKSAFRQFVTITVF